MASTTISTYSATLALIMTMAAMWANASAWRPQLWLASADRPKFPFGGRRREPVEEEPTGPGLLDEVAGGRYGGGQPLLPTLGTTADKGSERKLPRLFPDAHDGDEQREMGAFDHDAPAWGQPSAAASVGLAPPPPPPPTPDIWAMGAAGTNAWPLPAATDDTAWPQPTTDDTAWPLPSATDDTAWPQPTTDDTDQNPWVTGPQLWNGPSAGGVPADSPLPLPTAPATPFGDLAPIEPWESSTSPYDTTPTSWLHVDQNRAAGTAADADSWHAWQWQNDDAATAPTSALGIAGEPTFAPEPETDDVIENRWTGVRWVEPPQAVAEALPAIFAIPPPPPPLTSAEVTHAGESVGHDVESSWWVDEPNAGADPVGFDGPIAEHAIADPAATSALAAPPTIWTFALPVMASVAEPAMPAEAASPVDQWSDLFDIFRDDDDALDPDALDPDVLDPDVLEHDDEDDEEDEFVGDHIDDAGANEAVVGAPVSAFVSAGVDSPNDMTEPIATTEPSAAAEHNEATEPSSATAIADAVQPDRWASTLLERLRSVVATTAEPAEVIDEFTSRFARGLRMRLTDNMVLQYFGQGVHLLAPDAEAQVLFATTGSTMREVAAVGHQTRPGCGVPGAGLCPAIAQNDTLTFDDSSSFDACPFLAERSAGSCAAVCVPIDREGSLQGVVHITTLRNASLPASTVAAIEDAATQVRGRIVELHESRQTKSAMTGA